MSNLIKSGFVAFSQDNTLIINANENKIIKGIDSAIEEAAIAKEGSLEEAIANAMIEDADIDGLEDDSDVGTKLTLDTAELFSASDIKDIPELNEAINEANREKADSLIDTAKKEAEEIINSAHDEAEKLRGQAYDEAENIKQQAREEGYQTGYNEGIEAASKEYEEKNNELDIRLNSLNEEFSKKEEELIKETENNMVSWLMTMIPQITGVAVDGMDNVLLYIINSSMRELDDSTHFVIKVSSEDYAEIADNKEKIYGALNPSIDMEIFEDSKLSKLQCIIETDNGIVDIGLDTKLNNLIRALKLMMKE